MDYSVLIAELQNDPLSRGYAGMTDAQRLASLQTGSQIEVNDNGVISSFNAALVKKITVYAGQGDDHVEVSDDIFLRAELYGDSGNDYLKAGSGNDLLSGGEGDDLMYGGAGGDYLSGWLGIDLLDGGDGNDFGQDFSSEPTMIVSIETFIPY